MEDIFDLIGNAPTAPGLVATGKQLGFIRDLLEKCGHDEPEELESLTIAQASEYIDSLKDELDGMSTERDVCWR